VGAPSLRSAAAFPHASEWAMMPPPPSGGWQGAPSRVSTFGGISTPVRHVVSALLALALLLPAAVPAAAEFNSYCPPGHSVPTDVSARFADLKAQLGDLIPPPAECEHQSNGDIVQAVGGSRALLYWRTWSSTPTFFDGRTHYALTADGLVTWDDASPDPPGTVPPAAPSTSGPRAPSATSPAAPPAAQSFVPHLGQGVMFLSGIGTDSATAAQNFAALQYTLGVRDKLAAMSVLQFSYSGYKAWGADASCAALGDTEANLAAQLRGLRDQHTFDHLALIGHSRGGLLAFQVGVDYPDLVPFVNAVVAVDTPFLGVSSGKADIYDLNYICEPALSELTARRASADQWSAWNAQGVDFLLGHGVRVRAIGNKSDCVYNPIACHAVLGSFFGDDSWAEAVSSSPTVQHWYDVPTNGGILASHSVVLTSPDVLADIATVVAGT